VDCTDDATAESDVCSVEPKSNLIDLYSVGHALVLWKWEEGKDEVPFKQTLQLKGPQGETVRVSALFDGGAMVGAMCSSIFRMVKHRLSGWGPSRRQLRMANGLIVPSQAVWKGTMVLGGITFQGEFKVFDSKGGWAFLFGKPLMRAAHATHNFETDVVKIRTESGAVTLSNQINDEAAERAIALGVSLTLDVKQWGTMKGGSSGRKPPSRQVFDSQHGVAVEQIDKHEHIEHVATTQEPKLPEHEEVETTRHKHDDDSEMGDTESTGRCTLQTGGEDNTPAREVLTTVVPAVSLQADTPAVQTIKLHQAQDKKDSTE
jgi:hypothetical protein